MLALIDGDVLAHRACEDRRQGLPPPGYDELHHITDPKERKEVSEHNDREFLVKCWDTFLKGLENSLERLYASDYLMAVKSSSNYRVDMYPLYKMNRHKNPESMNRFVPMLRKIAVQHGIAVYSTGREADDLLRMWAVQATLAGDPYAIVTVDKDLDCIPGLHLNPRTNAINDVPVEYSIKFFYQQLLMGDPTDNIPGLPGIGPVKANSMLAGIDSEEEMQETVAFMYRELAPGYWLDWLLSNGKMLYLQSKEHDYFTCRSWPVVKAILADEEAQKLEQEQRDQAAENGIATGLTGVGSPSPRLATPAVHHRATAPASVPPPWEGTALQGGTAPRVPANPDKSTKLITPRPFTGSLKK